MDWIRSSGMDYSTLETPAAAQRDAPFSSRTCDFGVQGIKLRWHLISEQTWRWCQDTTTGRAAPIDLY